MAELSSIDATKEKEKYNTLAVQRDALRKASLCPSPSLFAEFKVAVTSHFSNSPAGELFPFPFSAAPFEADTHLAWLAPSGAVSLIMSSDSDLFVLGTNLLITKLSSSSVRLAFLMPSSIFPQSADLSPTYSAFENIPIRSRAIIAAIIGNDYFPGGLKRVGPKCFVNLQNFGM